MKITLLFLGAILCTSIPISEVWAQQGTSCPNAIPLVPDAQCSMQAYEFPAGTQTLWFEFTAINDTMGISVPQLYQPTAHIHRISVAQGTSSNCLFMGQQELIWAEPNDGLIHPERSTPERQNIAGLTIGQSYLLIVERGIPTSCGKGCTLAPQKFQMCIQSEPYYDYDLAELICPPYTSTGCQMVGNGGFDTVYSNTGYWDDAIPNHFTNIFNEFQNELVCYWDRMFGTPNLAGDTTGVPNLPNQPDQWAPYQAQMWSRILADSLGNPVVGTEGIMQKFSTPLLQSKTYLLRYDIRSWDQTDPGFLSVPDAPFLDSWHFVIDRSTDGNPWPYTAHQDPQAYLYNVIAADSGNALQRSTNYSHRAACFTVSQNGFDRLLIYPRHYQAGSAGWMQTKNISIVRFPYNGPDEEVLCVDSVQLNMCPVQGASYAWTPTTGLSNPNVAMPYVAPPDSSTWYVVTGTYIFDGDTCIVQDSVLVSPFDEVATITPDYQDICAGGAATIIGSAQFGHTWTSVPFDSTLVGQENNGGITVSPDTTTMYIVNILGPDSCIVTDTAIVNVVPPFDIEIMGPATMCCDTTVYSVDSGYTSYLFEIVPFMLFGSNGYDEIYPNWGTTTVDTAYVVCTATDSLGCTATDTLMVTRNCCDMEALLPVGTSYQSYGKCTGVTYASDLVAQGITSLSSPNPILIYGTLVIDVNYAISNCDDLRMGVDAKIDIEPGNLLSFIDNDVTAGCDKMWDGIYVADSTASILMRADTVYDAKNAVVINHGGKYSITDNQFFNNGICIKVTEYNGVLGNNNVNEIISKNEFASTRGTLKEPYDVAPMDNCEAGIQVTDVFNFRLRHSNIYRRLDVGVEGVRTSALIRSQEFYNMHNPNPSVYGNDIGAAIYFRGSTGVLPPHVQLFTGGTNQGVTTPNIVNGCYWGIRAVDNVDLTARFNEIYDCRLVGIYAGFNRLGDHKIVGNTIEGGNGQVGINCYANRATTIDVRNNFINWDLPDGQDNFRGGVVVENVIPNAFPVQVFVRNNQVKNTEKGVALTNMHYCEVRQNHIRIQKTNAELLNAGIERSGVNINMCNDAILFRNRVRRTVDIPDSISSPYLKGIHIENSIGAIVQRNETQRIGQGIHAYGANGGTDYLCNKLLRPYHGFMFDSAEVQGTFSPNVATDNKWINEVGYYRLTGLASGNRQWYYNPNGSNRQPFPMNFQVLGPLGSIPVTNATSGCQTIIDPQGPNANLREAQFGAIVRDDKTYDFAVAELKLYDQYYTLSCFEADNGWLSLGTVDDIDYQQFYTNCQNENLGKLCEANAAIIDGNYSSAQVSSSSVACNNAHESNMKLLQAIYLATWAQDNREYTPAQHADLEYIACQNGLSGGPAVYSARVMLGSNYACANGAKNLNIDAKGQSRRNVIMVYPNPANDILNINTSMPLEGISKLILFDMSGREVAQYDLTPNALTQSIVLNLSGGAYFYQITDNNAVIQSGKIVVLD